jgi:amino acid permease
MYEQLENRTPERFQMCVVVAFGFLFVFTMLFGAAAYMIFGTDTLSNILKNFPRNWPADVARVGMCLVVLGVYPIMLSPMVAPIRTWESEKAAKQPFHYRKFEDQEAGGEQMLQSVSSIKELAPKASRFWSTTMTIAILALSMGVSFLISDLGLMNVINGAISVTMFVAFCPTMVGLHLGEPPTTTRRTMLYALFLFGLGMSAAGFVFTDNNAPGLTKNCMIPLH